MRHLILACIAVLAVACGGSNKPAAYEPDLSDVQGAIEAYNYSVQKLDERVAELVFAEADREAMMKRHRENVRQSYIKDHRYAVQDREVIALDDNRAVALISWLRIIDGKLGETGDTRWMVFIREADGKWRMSQSATDEFRKTMPAEMRAREIHLNAPAPAPAANAPDNAPAPANAPAPDNAPAPASNG